MSAAPAFADAVAGCLLGGAVGDALGAMVEFDSLEALRERYGPEGVVDFPAEGGRITDDTQMTLFTAEALIRTRRRYEADRIDHAVDHLWWAYRRWFDTQALDEEPGRSEGGGDGLAAEPALRHRRAPGNTCLAALAGGHPGYVDQPVNNSKGCGGVMRVAPVGLVARRPAGLGIASAALTHGHPSGHLAAGALADIIARLLTGTPLRAAAEQSIAALASWAGHEETTGAIGRALAWAERQPAATPETVGALGEGWIAQEALAIAVYCALTGATFEAAVLAAVNHSGDSDSTAAITGNLLGAAGGRAVVPKQWVEALEERGLVERVAQDLAAAFAPSS